MAKKYKCPYCENRFIRADLIAHIDKKHKVLIPQNYTASRVVYDMVNKTDHGTCRVCGKNTTWNEKSGRYNVLCGNPKCKQKMREDYQKNMLRVRGTYNILNDPEQQKIMLANRKISGEYRFSDGGVVGYTGTYEKKCLEFMDIVMQIPSTDIMSPGPTMVYTYQGKQHVYIPDFYYIPYNLIIEVKDGGSNANTKDSESMRASREKTIEKERVITDKGVFNYIRLTDNDFAQLIEIFMTIKEKLLNGDSSKTYKINESAIIESYFSGLNTPSFRDSKEVYDWIRKNIKYRHVGYFNTPDKVIKNGYGDCHEQAFLAQTILENMGYKCQRYFFIETPRKGNIGGTTHTALTYYYNGKYYWFETSWEEQYGIHEYKSEKAIIDDIKRRWQLSPDMQSLYIKKTNVQPPRQFSNYVYQSIEANPIKESSIYLNLQQFSKVRICNEFIDRYKFRYPFLDNIDNGPNSEGYIWTNSSDEIIAVVNIYHGESNKITFIYFDDRYIKYGLLDQLIKYIKEFFYIKDEDIMKALDNVK